MRSGQSLVRMHWEATLWCSYHIAACFWQERGGLVPQNETWGMAYASEMRITQGTGRVESCVMQPRSRATQGLPPGSKRHATPLSVCTPLMILYGCCADECTLELKLPHQKQNVGRKGAHIAAKGSAPALIDAGSKPPTQPSRIRHGRRFA